MTDQDHRDVAGAEPTAGGDVLPPLAPPEASDDERARAVMAWLVARRGAPSLEHYRRTYATAGLEWPGDEEIRRRHPVAPDDTTGDTGARGRRGDSSAA